jgi:hypothetical protein
LAGRRLRILLIAYGLPVNGQRPTDDRLVERILELAPRFGIEVLGPSPL